MDSNNMNMVVKSHFTWWLLYLGFGEGEWRLEFGVWSLEFGLDVLVFWCFGALGFWVIWRWGVLEFWLLACV
jgi:hypothetical protein